jgi:16S rRNA (guanine1207-N2)-methyltransferase
MTLNTFSCFSGNFTLERRPPTPHQPLQAWDATDEYLLETIALALPAPGRSLLINDSFGALAVALHALHPHTWGDSFTAQLALEENRQRNQISDPVTFIPSTATPPGGAANDHGITACYDMVLWRIPKSQALWQQQLVLLQPLLQENTQVLVGGMEKHLPVQTREVLEQLGTVDILHAQKKARLFRVTPQPGKPQPPPPPEKLLTVPEYNLKLGAGPNVFARAKFDAGAHVFLDQFSRLPIVTRIADLGCGNGILGLAAKQLQPEAEVHFFDESYQAVAAAEANYHRNGFNIDSTAWFHLDDCLSHYQGEPFDLILCNPPFHQGHVIGDQTAWQMFTQSRKHLRPGGELWVVGNRHLNYHIKLKRLFGNYRQIAAHPKFVVLAAHR